MKYLELEKYLDKVGWFEYEVEGTLDNKYGYFTDYQFYKPLMNHKNVSFIERELQLVLFQRYFGFKSGITISY